MFRRMGDGIRRFMEGRNGVDALACFWCVLGIVISLIFSALGLSLLSILAWIPIVLAFIRVFSRDIERRHEQNQRFKQFFSRIRGRRNYRYFRCPSCKTMVRVPKGKGKIRITCPSCRERFEKKT